ncbi:TPA: hypothetical protein J1300_003076 [Escherichia coli]|nr:hypothetical protein [Escherichia coli]HBA9157336.1 hypothetical protein [Escherichia coli]
MTSRVGNIQSFVQQAVDHWPRLLAIHFTLYSTEGVCGQQIQIFCSSFHRRVHERITERNHTVSPSAPVVLRWLQEQYEGAPIRYLLLLSQTSICHPRVGVMADEECAQLVDLLQQTWSVISAGGQCRVERYFWVVRPGTLDQFVALKTTVQSLMLPVMATIAR